MKIPKIVHQIWEGKEGPLPEFLKELSETWKENHPDWQYEFWDFDRIDSFIKEHYPQYYDVYYQFPRNVQRWDAIRYLILKKTGGLYVDLDYECIEAFDDLLKDKTCCFSAEPKEHARIFGKSVYFNNALMASVANHSFMSLIVEYVFEQIDFRKEYPDKMQQVLQTTGPLTITQLYEDYADKNSIYIIPPEIVSPFTKAEVEIFLSEYSTPEKEKELQEKLNGAKAVHYFFGTWL